MIDIHSHLLPDFDDGARTLEETAEMLKLAAADGIEQMITTPHMHAYPTFTKTRQQVHEAYASLRRWLEENSSPVRVLPGSENYISSEFLDHLDRREVIPLNAGPYLLIEFGGQFMLSNLEYVLTAVQNKGYIPILAHPERMPQFHRRLERLEEFVRLGARLQLTAESLCGNFGQPIESLSLQIVKEGLAHFVASDAHGIGRRLPRLSDAYQVTVSLVGEEYAQQWFVENPRKVVEGKAI